MLFALIGKFTVKLTVDSKLTYALQQKIKKSQKQELHIKITF